MTAENPKTPHVLVDWIDASKYGKTIYTIDAAIKECKVANINTVGYLIGETDSAYLIAGEQNAADKRFRDITAIPKNCVLNLIMLYEKTPIRIKQKKVK